jgi:hypothetical protein
VPIGGHCGRSSRRADRPHDASDMGPTDVNTKYDLILFSGTVDDQAVYRATSPPEGRPYGIGVCKPHEVLRKAFGHPGTSELVLKAALVHYLRGGKWCSM